jgi:phosphonate transport system substrate-binding protein
MIAACSSTGWAVDAARAEQKKYVFGVVPQFEQRKLFAIWKPIIDDLERRTGLSFDLVTTLKIQDFEKEFIHGDFDFVYMNPYHIRDKAPLRGVLVVRKDGPIQTVAGLSGKVVAFPSPNALGASLLMRADLDRLYHIKVIPLYVKTHSSVYLHVIKDLAAGGGGVQKSLQEQGPEIRDSLRVLYTTRPMTSHPVAAHPRVPKEVREKVRRALLDMGAEPEGKELLSKIPMKEITAASTDDYKEMQEWGLDAYWDPFWKED